MIRREEIQAMITRVIPGAKVEVSGEGDHFGLLVRASAFSGKTLLDQHRMVQEAIRPAIDDGRIHAAKIKTIADSGV